MFYPFKTGVKSFFRSFAVKSAKLFVFYKYFDAIKE